LVQQETVALRDFNLAFVGLGSCMDGARRAREKNLTFRETILVQSCIRPLNAAVVPLALM
jgi:hypothetical protein